MLQVLDFINCLLPGENCVRNTVEKIDNRDSDLQTESEEEDGEDVDDTLGEVTTGDESMEEAEFLSRLFLAGVEVDWWWSEGLS